MNFKEIKEMYKMHIFNILQKNSRNKNSNQNRLKIKTKKRSKILLELSDKNEMI